MKDHIPTLALVAGLAMILIALVVLTLNAKQGEGLSPVLLGLTSGVTGIAGAIGGFSMQQSKSTASQPDQSKNVLEQSKNDSL